MKRLIYFSNWLIRVGINIIHVQCSSLCFVVKDEQILFVLRRDTHEQYKQIILLQKHVYIYI